MSMLKGSARGWRFQKRRRAYLLGSVCLLSLGSLHAQETAPTVSAGLDDVTNQLHWRIPARAAQQNVNTAPEDFDKVKLTPGSLLQMDVYGVPEYNGVSLRLDADGRVSVPHLSPLSVAGMTLLEAQEVIAQAFVTGQILIHPTVRLNLVQYNAGYVSVLGEVQLPGRYQLIAPRPLADVLALAGGETMAAGNDVEIQRASTTGSRVVEHIHLVQKERLAVLQQTTVGPGDSVLVHRAGAVYVMGAVNRPGGYLMVDNGGLSVLQALSLAGGASLDAAKGGMYIIRPHGESYEEIKVPFKRVLHEARSETELQVNDVLYLPRSGWKVTFLDGSAIIGAAVSGALFAYK